MAMKLKKMGYNVTKVTAIAGARFCDPKDVYNANNLLPKDALRIEDDLDIVPFLPPWASALGDKLWLVNDVHNKESDLANVSSLSSTMYKPKYISRSALLDNNNPLHWVDNSWTNIRVPETIRVQNKSHRITSHRSKLQLLIEDLRDLEVKSD